MWECYAALFSTPLGQKAFGMEYGTGALSDAPAGGTRDASAHGGRADVGPGGEVLKTAHRWQTSLPGGV